MWNFIQKRSVLVGIFLCLFAEPALSKTIFTECYGCSENSSRIVALSIFQGQQSQTSDMNIHVADIATRRILSYEVVNKDGEAVAILSSTPAALENVIQIYSDAYNRLAQRSIGVEIPQSAMRSAWEYTKCAYCENFIKDFLKPIFAEHTDEIRQSLSTLAEVFGLVKTDVRYSFSFPLSAGGEVYIGLVVNALAGYGIEVINVVDSNGNRIPADDSGLDKASIRVDSQAHAAEINSYINRFKLHVPEHEVGIVLINTL